MSGVTLARPSTLMIPSLTVFREISREAYFDRFAANGHIKSVVLPLIEDAGFYFPYTIDGAERTGNVITEDGTLGDQFIQLLDVANFFAARNISIYLSLNLSMPDLSLASGACDVLDQIGKRGLHCCVNNRITLQYLSTLLTQSLTLLKSAIPEGIVGIVINATNLWPLSAQSGRFLLTCFCPDCVKTLKDLSRNNFDPNWFSGFPNGINLGLAERPGIEEYGEELGAIVPVSDLKRNMLPEEVIDACSQVRGTLPAIAFDKGNFENQRAQFQRWARQLMTYLGAKSDLSIAACTQVFGFARTTLPNVRRILMVEDDPYDWSSGMFLDELTSGLASDELWLPISSLDVTSNLRLRPILARRACYYVSEFFELLHVVSNPALRNTLLRTTPIDRIRRSIQRHGDDALSELQGEGDAVLPEAMSKQPDAVTVGLDDRLVAALIQRAATTSGLA